MKSYLRYLAVSLRVEMRELIIYRLNFIIEIIMVAVRVFLLWALWTALYIGKTEVNGIDLQTMIFYSVTEIIFEALIKSNIEKAVTGNVRTGNIALMITRPVSYPVALFFEQLAHTGGNVIIRVIPYSVLLLVSGLWKYSSVSLNIWFVISVILSYILAFLYQLSFGFLAFWTMELDGFSNARTALMRFFSGSLIPIWFFPKILQRVADYLPFQAIYSTPLSICIGKIIGQDISFALINQLIWITFFFCLSVFVWSRARRRVIVNGG